MINIKKIFAKNFFSIGNAGIEITLEHYKKTLVTGANGSSKSSALLDTITFVLYNKPFRKINKGMVVNSKNKKDCLVSVEFENNGKQYKVERGIKPAIFNIYENGILLNQPGSNLDYQDILEHQILNVNYKTFIQVVLLGSTSYQPFMKLSSGDRRVIIDNLLDIKIFTDMSLILKDRYKGFKEEFSNITSDIQYIRDKISEKEKYIFKVGQRNNEQSDKIKNDIVVCENNIKSHSNNVEKYKLEYDNLVQEFIDISPLRNKINKFMEARGKLQGTSSTTKNTISFYESNDNCPTCKQVIDNTFKEELLLNSKTKLEEVSSRIIEANSHIDKLSTQIKDLENKQENINRTKSLLYNAEFYKRTETHTLDRLKNTLTELENSVTIDTNTEKNDVLILQSKLDELLLKLDKCKKFDRLYKVASNILKDDGIKTIVIKQYLPVLNNLINYYLGKMEFYASFYLDENFDETIKSRFRDELSYENFSEGEKRRIDLAILFAFRKISELKNTCNCNLLIMDEIFDSTVDMEGINDLSEILNEFENNNIYVISHRGLLEDNFNRTLEFVKVNDYSIMKERIN